MNIAGHDVAVCSWSLQPKDMADLVSQVLRLGLNHVQLALVPLVTLDAAAQDAQIAQLRAAGIAITAGMVNFASEDYSTIAAIRETGGYVPNKEWESRRDTTIEAARLAQRIGLKMSNVHAGFIPPSNHPAYETMVGRLKELAAAVAPFGQSILLETGQEHATELLQFLNDLGTRNVGVNFDPANMILYGAGDPIEAVHTLGRHIAHVHIKDAMLSSQPGVKWGEEVPFGTGQVCPRSLLQAFEQVGYKGPFAIEREAGNARFDDVKFAIETLKRAV